MVGDVAATAAGHEDLGAELSCPVDRHDRERPAGRAGGPARPRGGKQARGPGADDEDVDGDVSLTPGHAHRYHR